MISTARMLESLAKVDDNDGFEADGATTRVGVMRDLLVRCPPGAELVAYDVLDNGEICGLFVKLPSGKEKWVRANTRRMH